MSDTWWLGVLPAALTLIVFSRIFGDNPAVRFVQYLFVGMSLGLAVVAALQYVVRPALQRLAAADAMSLEFWLIGIAATALLLLPLRRFQHRLPRTLAALPIALLLGVSAAVMVIGVIAGTLLPQLQAATAIKTLEPAALVGAGLALIVVLLVLWSLRNAEGQALPNGSSVWLQRAGRFLLLTAFGVMLAAAVSGYLTALQERIIALFEWIRHLASA